MVPVQESACWLCGALAELTNEHVPPRSAFNADPVILMGLSEEARKAGYVAWEGKAEHKEGHARRSLCEKCNRLGGRVFVPSYRDLVQKVAEQVATRIPLKSIKVSGVRNRHLIVRQILMQFVTANGAEFVTANPWIRSFIESRVPHSLPPEVRLYLFATQSRVMRFSGLSGHVLMDRQIYRIVAECTCWPLGTILSFSDLSDEPLLEITDWSQVRFRDKTLVELALPVNPAVSDYPVDFRDDLDILIDQHKIATHRLDEGLARQMREEVARRGGGSDDDRIFTAAPSTIALHADE